MAKILFVFDSALINAEKWISVVSVFNSDLWTPHAVIMNLWLYLPRRVDSPRSSFPTHNIN